MCSIKDKVDKEENEQLRSIPAQRLIEKLSLLKNRINSAKKRWFWELLQNASDYNESVNVKLIVTDTTISFFHDGAPFSIRDVLNLISPDSNKQEDEVHKDNIGKFGTGLVSTHILSSVLNIEGLCVDDEENSFKFSLSLDRSCYKDKQALIEQITQAKEQLKESLQEQSLADGFNTSFSYPFGNTLPDLPQLTFSEIDLGYIYDALPYTLCFMPKVRSVIIQDQRDNAKVGVFKIGRSVESDDEVVFSIDADAVTSSQRFAYFQNGDISSAFRVEDNGIVAFPKELSRLFCGLPLVGTEDIGMPFLLNSLKFEPTTEREGVELEPSSNEVNRKLFSASIDLYDRMLDYIESNKIRNAFYLTHLCRKFNGTQASNQQFYNLYLAKYKQHVLSHRIVANGDSQFVSFSSIYLPFKESKPDTNLYDNSKLLNNNRLPIAEDYEQWFDATDFTLFPDQKYTYEDFAKEIEEKNNIFSFGKAPSEVLAWLLLCTEYFVGCDRYIFSKHKLLPNQSGNLCSISIYADNSLPQELKEIYDSLYAVKGNKIEDKLLDKSFNGLNLLNQEYTLEMLADDIDKELSAQYANNQGNTASISSSLNNLYNWINNSTLPKEKLAAYFHWYYPKRATLIVDMLTESQREQALIIAQSGKMESLATLASSELSDEELQLIVANIKKLPVALSLLAEKIDDKEFADSKEGDLGEEIVYKDLQLKYPRTKGFNVVWASRDRNEPCYDFEITKNGQPFCYCDAKTTRRGIANADSIPFFMRRSQWDFLQTLDDSIPYIIARVFMKDGGEIKYMRIMNNN